MNNDMLTIKHRIKPIHNKKPDSKHYQAFYVVF